MDLSHDIQLLMNLQEIDSAIHEREERSQSLPLLHKEKTKNLEEIALQVKEIKSKITILKQQEEKLLAAVQSDIEALKEKKNTLLLLSDSKEYNSLLKEVDALEKSNRSHEEEKLLLYEELSIQQEKLQEYTSLYKTKKKEIEEFQSELQEVITRHSQECNELQEQRKQLVKEISAPIYSRYEFIRGRIPYPVLTPISQGVCSACRIVLPTQIAHIINTTQQIYTCPSCQRILYL